MKNKIVAAVLAFPFGALGVHRFYLGQRFLGVLYLAFFIFTVFQSTWEPVFLASFLLPFIDAILLYVMPVEEFDTKYNRRRVTDYQAKSRRRRKKDYDFDRRHLPQRQQQKDTFHAVKREGIQRYRSYDYEGAIDSFLDALDLRPGNAAIHFNLACCFSIIEEEEQAYKHLEKAVENGFHDREKIHTHDALAFLRSSPLFDDFVTNGYRLKTNITPPEAPILNLEKIKKEQKQEEFDAADELLDQIIKLGELREKGILTEDEYIAQKKRILDQ